MITSALGAVDRVVESSTNCQHCSLGEGRSICLVDGGGEAAGRARTSTEPLEEPVPALKLLAAAALLGVCEPERGAATGTADDAIARKDILGADRKV